MGGEGNQGTPPSVVAVPLQKSVGLPFLSIFFPNSDLFLVVHGFMVVPPCVLQLRGSRRVALPSPLGTQWGFVVGIIVIAIAFVLFKGKPR